MYEVCVCSSSKRYITSNPCVNKMFNNRFQLIKEVISELSEDLSKYTSGEQLFSLFNQYQVGKHFYKVFTVRKCLFCTAIQFCHCSQAFIQNPKVSVIIHMCRVAVIVFIGFL